MKISLVMMVLPLMLLGAGCVQDSSRTEPAISVPDNQAAVEADEVNVDLSGRGLREVPKDVIRRADITSLDLSDNSLEGALPAEIRQMSALQVLDASGNQMTGVPAEIGQLRNLRILDLSDNKLTGLPYELGDLQNLELLDLTGNLYSMEDLARIESSLPKTTVIRR